MSASENVSWSLRRDMRVGSTALEGSQQGASARLQSFNVVYDSAGAKTLAIAFDRTKIEAIEIQCDQAITSIVFTGTTGPVTTPGISAGSAWQWSLEHSAEPFGANCTAIVVTLAAFPAGVTSATLKIMVAEGL